MPKILFITADQWRADCLGVRGHACVRTPNLDRLAADGVSFTRHYAQASPCGPSRASLHTGTYLMTHRSASNGTPLDRRFTNIALEVRKLGLEAGLIGYTDTSVDPRELDATDARLRTYTGVAPGYRQLVPDGESPIAWTRHLRALGHAADVPSHPEDEPALWRPDLTYPGVAERGPTFAPARYPAELSDTAFSVDRAIDALRERAGGGWFLHLSLLRPHPPYVAPAPYHAMYDPADGPAPLRHMRAAREAAVHPYAAHIMRLTNEFLAEQGLVIETERDRRQLRATYWGMMSEVDFHLGRLFAYLREAGEYDDTLIVFTSDHGEQLFDHWTLGKRSFYEQSFHIPLIVRAPGMPPAARGRVVEHFTENVDVMPTLLDGVGAPVPAQCDGLSLMPWVRGETPESWRDAAFFELDFRDVLQGVPEREFDLDLESCSFACLRGSRFKYVHFAGLAPLLFDLDEDPGELVDRAADPEYLPALCELAQRLLSHRMRHAERTLTGMFLSRDEGLVHADEARRRPAR